MAKMEGEVEAQVAADLNITWETPSTPAHPDDYVILHGIGILTAYASFVWIILLLKDGLHAFVTMWWYVGTGTRMVRPYFFEFLAHVGFLTFDSTISDKDYLYLNTLRIYVFRCLMYFKYVWIHDRVRQEEAATINNMH